MFLLSNSFVKCGLSSQKLLHPRIYPRFCNFMTLSKFNSVLKSRFIRGLRGSSITKLLRSPLSFIKLGFTFVLLVELGFDKRRKEKAFCLKNYPKFRVFKKNKVTIFFGYGLRKFHYECKVKCL